MHFRDQRKKDELTAICKMLFGLQALSCDYSETTAKQLEDIMKKPVFTENLGFFWRECLGWNPFLRDFYFQTALSPLASRDFKDCARVFKHLLDSSEVYGPLADYLSDENWLCGVDSTRLRYFGDERRPSDEDVANGISGGSNNAASSLGRSWRKNVLKKLFKFDEQQRALSLIKNIDQSAKIDREYKRFLGFAKIQLALICIIFISGFLLPGAYRLPSWFDVGDHWSLSVFAVLSALVLWRAFVVCKDYIFGGNACLFGDVSLNRWSLYGSSVIFLLLLTLFCWEQLLDRASRITALVAALCVPFIPLIRGAIGSLAIGVACGLASLPTAFFAGRILSSIFDFIMTSGR